jgi:renalase
MLCAVNRTSSHADVIVVGGGMAGLTCARALASRGSRVVVLDKGRAVGGRMSTRRYGDVTFDHGAQYFTVRSPEFAALVEDLSRRGVVAPFGKELARSGEMRWVGTPTMRAVPQHLSLGLDVRTAARVTRLERDAEGWSVSLEDGTRLEASSVVLANPAPQARELLAASNEPIPESLLQVEVSPCWALMVEVQGEVGMRTPTLRDTPPFSWVCRQNDDGLQTRWIAHADREFSERYLESTQDEAVELLTPRLLALLGASRTSRASAHRWRFARTTKPAGMAAIPDLDRRLVLAGDYCLGDRVEDAFTSGLAAARALGAG